MRIYYSGCDVACEHFLIRQGAQSPAKYPFGRRKSTHPHAQAKDSATHTLTPLHPNWNERRKLSTPQWGIAYGL